MPADLEMSVTRNYGETAAEKSNELLWHMLLAVLSVSLLIWLALGRREAAVVLLAIPVTLALTLFTFYLYGYTLNRITLFALIFSIGILVDDAIVVVENIVRHARLHDRRRDGGLAATRHPRRRRSRQPDDPGDAHRHRRDPADGVRRRPDGALHAADSRRRLGGDGVLAGRRVHRHALGGGAAAAAATLQTDHDREDRLTRALSPRAWAAAHEPAPRAGCFSAASSCCCSASVALVPLQLVHVKMLPFDNKSEFQVMVDMPEGTALEETARVASALADAALSDPRCATSRSMPASSAPYNFNGLVRHYFLRRGSHSADLQVNLLPKDERREQSHDIAKRVRERLLPIARRFGATHPGRRSAARAAGAADARGRGLRPDAERAHRARARRFEASWRARRASSTWTGMSRSRSRRIDLVVDEEKAALAGVPATADRDASCAWRPRARPSGCCTTPRAAKTCRSCCSCRARRRAT